MHEANKGPNEGSRAQVWAQPVFALTTFTSMGHSLFSTLKRIPLSFFDACVLWMPRLVRKPMSKTGTISGASLPIPDLYDATISELLAGLNSGLFTSVQLVSAYLSRIDEVNLKGPALRAVLEVNSAALEQARRCDEERRSAKPLGRLHGIPILVKDNISTRSPEGQAENLNTSAGSLALLGCYPAEDATVIKKLRQEGAIILGKTSMSEWSNWRGLLPDGWSSRGEQVTNPYYPGGTPLGSSAGSAVGTAIGLAAAALGTETDGSISAPSSVNNVVGLKPTVGLTSRKGVVPISNSCDTVGPICRTVSDIALVLQIIAGHDLGDDKTFGQPPLPDYLSCLDPEFIRNKRIGVLRRPYCDPEALYENKESMAYRVARFDEALDMMKEIGAHIVDPVAITSTKEIFQDKRAQEMLVFRREFKNGINHYLANLPDCPTGVRSLGALIEFNREHEEAHYKGKASQTALIASNEDIDDETYQKALDFCIRKGGEEGIDACLKEHNLDLLVAPFSERSSWVSALAGYPTLTVPLGFLPPSVVPIETGRPYTDTPGLPFGLVFMGTKWSEVMLLGCAYSYELASKIRRKRRAYAKAIPQTQIQTS